MVLSGSVKGRHIGISWLGIIKTLHEYYYVPENPVKQYVVQKNTNKLLLITAGCRDQGEAWSCKEGAEAWENDFTPAEKGGDSEFENS